MHLIKKGFFSNRLSSFFFFMNIFVEKSRGASIIAEARVVCSWIIKNFQRGNTRHKPYNLQTCKSLAKRTRQSTQVWKNRTCVRTCDGWPNRFASRLSSSCISRKVVNFTHISIQMACDQLCRLALGCQTMKALRRLAYELELDQNVISSQRKWVAKRNTRKTCVVLRVRLVSAWRKQCLNYNERGRRGDEVIRNRV